MGSGNGGGGGVKAGPVGTGGTTEGPEGTFVRGAGTFDRGGVFSPGSSPGARDGMLPSCDGRGDPPGVGRSRGGINTSVGVSGKKLLVAGKSGV